MKNFTWTHASRANWTQSAEKMQRKLLALCGVSLLSLTLMRIYNVDPEYLMLHWFYVFVAGMFFIPQLQQNQRYHQFAGDDSLENQECCPNQLNVWSNVPLLWVAVIGIWTDGGIFWISLIFVSLGSAFYHWKPTNFRLIFDRLPMAVSFSLGVLRVAEIDDYEVSWAEQLFIVTTSCLTVLYWSFQDDLRPYIATQYSMVVSSLYFIPVGRKTGFLVLSVLLYAAAKIAEVNDGYFHRTLGCGGHVIKHLLVAASMLFFLGVN
jgi:hypothetical protein